MNKKTNKPLFLILFAAITSGVLGAFMPYHDFIVQAQEDTEFSAVLSGEEEVPPVDTQALGIADFSQGEDDIQFTINATDIEGVTAGHIHDGIEGENGDVVVTLFEYDTPQDQVSENGTITEDDLEGPLEGSQISDLVNAMNDGDTYVNIHTEQNPDGEIRGQIINLNLQMDTEEQ